MPPPAKLLDHQLRSKIGIGRLEQMPERLPALGQRGGLGIAGVGAFSIAASRLVEPAFE